jgi:hypothetical protein
MPHMRPEFVEFERTAEFAVMTFLAITGAERAKRSAIGRTLLALRDVDAAGSVAAFAADIDQAVSAKFPPVTARTPEADGVATEAVRIGIGLPLHQRRKRMAMSA